MFVQVIEGRARDGDKLREQWEEWGRELKSGAEGYLGGTGGVPDGGEFIAIAWFDSEDASRGNSARPEQDRWWSDTEAACERSDGNSR